MAHLAPSLKDQKTALDARLQATQSENADLLDTVLQQRREIEQLISGLENVIANVDASNAALPPDQMAALTDDAVLLDVHLRTKG